MSARRDRHGRGLRGPLALSNPYTATPVRPPRTINHGDWFAEAVAGSVNRIREHCPEALRNTRVGIEDVPVLTDAWRPDRVPLAAAVEADEENPGQVVVFRRPLERRAASRQGLRILVHRTIVEQLAALTGLDVTTIDPSADPDDDDDD
ncbi:metallopeptidase family protein [Enemella sp. A6]|uniref:metallopeptidase family protein n=1 Tax=Enemella sp. A6 TaxID=3440152 RepID=UPI003EBA7D9A